MTPRERMLRAFEFRSPDRLPVVHHPSPAGLYVHGQKLLDLFNRYPPDNPLKLETLPAPPAGTVDADGRYHQVATDGWGTTWDYRIFGVHGMVREHPLADYARLDAYAFPPLPAVGSDGFRAEQAQVAALKEQYLMFGGGASIFERICALRPMEDILMDLAGGSPELERLLDRLTDYWLACIDYWLAVGYDVICFGDDWGLQQGPMVRPSTFQTVFAPRYEAMFDRIHRGGARVFFHSCGSLGPLLDRLIELGIDGLWHQVNRYDADELAARCHANGVCVYLHPDRQHLVPRGTPAEIRAQIRRYAEIYQALEGGGIFYLEIENDAPFENVQALFEAVDEYR